MRVIRLPEVESKVGLKHSTIYALAKQKKFPQPIKLGQRASGWVESQVEDWLRERVSASAPTAV